MIPEYMTQAEYAVHCGCNRQRINKLVNNGRIPPECIKKIGRHNKINVQMADAILATSLDPAQSRNRKIGKKDQHTSSLKGMPEPDTLPRGKMTFEKARTLNEQYKAGLRMLELQEKQGSLVSLADVQETVAQKATEVRNKLLAIPSKVAADIIRFTNPADAQELLHSEIRQALLALTEESA